MKLAIANNAPIVSWHRSSGLVDEDRVLVSAARTESEAAGRLFDKYYEDIFRYIYHCTLDHGVTEDLTSNVFFCAFRRLGFFQWRRIPFRAWLYRIATNEVRMHYRKQKRALALSVRQADAACPNAASAPDTAAEAVDDYRLLHRALAKLGEKYRTVIVLRYLEGKPLSEICEITKKPEGTIKSHLHRGLGQLKVVLVQAGVTVPGP